MQRFRSLRALALFIFCLQFSWADWRSALNSLRTELRQRGYEIASVQEAIWEEPDLSQRKKIQDLLDEYLRGAPVKKSFEEELTGPKGVGPARKKFLELEGGLRILFKYMKDASFLNTTVSHEETCYLLDSLWGLDIVPTTLEKDIDNLKGSAQVWIPDADTARNVDSFREARGYQWMRAFDFLTANGDRKKDNFLVTKRGRVVAIDNGWAFHLPIGQVRAYPPEIPNSIFKDKEFLGHLEKVRAGAIRNLLDKRVSPDSRKLVLSRQYELRLKIQRILEGGARWKSSSMDKSSGLVEWDLNTQGELKNGQEFIVSLDSAPELKVAAFRLRYSSTRGAVLVVRTNEERSVLIDRIEISPTGGEDKFADKVIPLPEIIHRSEIKIEIHDPLNIKERKVLSIEKLSTLHTQETLKPSVSLTLKPELEIGAQVTVANEKYKVLKRLGNGARGVVYKVQAEDGSVLALKVAKSTNAQSVVIEHERQRFETLKSRGGLKTPEYRVLGDNFVIRTYYEGVLAKEFLKNFDPSSEADQYALYKLMDTVYTLSKSGIYAPIHNTVNWLWDGEDWVVIDISDGTTVLLSEFEALQKYHNDFKRRWLAVVPAFEKLEALWRIFLDTPNFGFRPSHCRALLAQ